MGREATFNGVEKQKNRLKSQRFQAIFMVRVLRFELKAS